MQTFGAFIVSLVAAGGLAVAAPAENQQTSTVKAAYNVNHVPHGPSELLKAYAKYHVPVSEKLRAAVDKNNLAKRQTGSALSSPDSDEQQWLTPISIGTPAQTLQMDLDTGSSDLWVFSNETAKSEVKGQKLYNPSKSSTARKKAGYSWSITYGDKSSSSGDVWLDKVSIGGFSVKNQVVEAATKVSASLTNAGASGGSGLLGLGFDSINQVKPKAQKTWFSNAANSLKQPVFTANLNHAADGSYNFGFIDTSLAKGDIFYADVDDSQGFWSIALPGYAINDNQINDSSFTGIVDTGTTLLLVDDSIVNDYYGNIQSAQYDDNQQGYTFDCSEEAPSFSFGIGEGVITVPGEYMNFGPIDKSGSTCFGSLQSSSDDGLNILGDIVIKATLTVFDYGNRRVGMAQKV